MTGVYGQCDKCGEEYHSQHQHETHLCLMRLRDISNKYQKSFVDMFKGIPIKIDDSLPDNGYYLAVSTKLFEQIQKG